MNEELKKEIKSNRLFNYEIAEHMGISEPTFYRMLRKPLTPGKRQLIHEAIVHLKNKQKEGYL